MGDALLWLIIPAAVYLLGGLFWVALSVRDTRRRKRASVWWPGLLLLLVVWPVLLIREVFRG